MNTEYMGMLIPQKQQKYDLIQADLRKKIEVDIEWNKNHLENHRNGTITRKTTTDYLFQHHINDNEYCWKRYIPKLSQDDVKPNTKATKLIYRQILIGKGYTGNSFERVKNNLSTTSYSYDTFNVDKRRGI